MTTSTTLAFTSASGGIRVATLDLPADGSPIATAILAHEFPGGSSLGPARMLARELNRYGFAVLVMDYPSSEAGGAPENLADFSLELESAAATLAFFHEAPGILVAHGRAAGAVIEAAEVLEGVRGVAFVGADLTGPASLRSSVRDRALLVVHSMQDEEAPFVDVTVRFDEAAHPKTLVPLQGADHLLTDARDAAYASAMLGQWARSLLQTKQEDVKNREKRDNCTVAVTRRGMYRTEILSNGHSTVADEPLGLGGTNTGPTPYGLFLASLASCTTVTLRMYADRKEWPLESVHVRLTHERVHAEDCDCEANGRTGMLDVIRKFVTLEGDLDEAQRKRLMQIAELCPVQRTLNSQPVMITTLQDSEQAVLECK